MSFQSTISAFQGVLSKFTFEDCERTFPEEFAVKRYLKKFQIPDPSAATQRKQQCWDNWLDVDSQLSRVKPQAFISFPVLYRARESLKQLARVRLNTCDLPRGSEFFPTRGQNSIESRLQRSLWSCTADNFGLFSDFVYGCKAMKRAFRQRYIRWYQAQNFKEPISTADSYIFRRYSEIGEKNPARAAFDFKLSCIVNFVQGSRFATVPKNNERDRPINVEPLGNIVTQRQIGNFLRAELKRLFGLDLDTLADVHRTQIRYSKWSTIDLKDASDSVTLALCEFLLPRHLFKLLLRSRSPMVLGLDKAYHLTNKISSMGNGFTFELMTLILVAVSRQLDPEASVFGDDILISNAKAEELIDVLEGVGFSVNMEKSFINSVFRESCGGNYHDGFGYIESFDFRWPQTIHDCCVFYNKALRLSRSYPCFERLTLSLRRHVPKVLQGVIENDFFSKEIVYDNAFTDPPGLSNIFRCRDHSNVRSNGLISRSLKRKLEAYAEKYNYDTEDLKIFSGLVYREQLRSDTLRHLSPKKHYGKLEMYLHAGRRAKDVLTGSGDWVTCTYLSVAGATMRWSDSALV